MLGKGATVRTFQESTRCENGCEWRESAIPGTMWAALALTRRKKERVLLREEEAF
jgi:hypothetical protein